jgi:flagellar hook-length control protein FliK
LPSLTSSPLQQAGSTAVNAIASPNRLKSLFPTQTNDDKQTVISVNGATSLLPTASETPDKGVTGQNDLVNDGTSRVKGNSDLPAPATGAKTDGPLIVEPAFGNSTQLRTSTKAKAPESDIVESKTTDSVPPNGTELQQADRPLSDEAKPPVKEFGFDPSRPPPLMPDQHAAMRVAATNGTGSASGTTSGIVAGHALSRTDVLGTQAIQPMAPASGSSTMSGETGAVDSTGQAPSVTWAEAVRGMASTAPRSLERNGQAEFRFRISPPDLGEVSIRLTAHRGAVTGEMTVGNSAIQQLVQTRLPELRQQLESVGVTVTSFNVTQQGESSPDSRRQNLTSWDTDRQDPLQPAQATGRMRFAAPSRGLVDVTA